MARRPIRPLVDKALGGKLDTELVTRRDAGNSFDQIARWLAFDHDIHVSSETVRGWCAEPDSEVVA